ncbi:hypothetical protein TrLO_g3213 [Triparma laevis f. longispina]|uniref:Uncharacterized protein n=1 Tax=Triparma laevis f. longispina TaxID=1714387 RepID=A0A9W7APM8_9STRA|nr:hypothetical protein TrLO_g3213 [Triparma laevis f. longispina]
MSDVTPLVLNPLSLKVIREKALTSEESSGLTPEDLADLLFDKTVLHLAYTNPPITGPLTSLDPFSNLTELYLQGNSLTSFSDGLSLLLNLKLLFLRNNRFKEIEGIGGLRNLEVLDLADNFIEGCGKYGKDVLPSKNLKVLDLENNPITKNSDHREKAVSSLPVLTILDGVEVVREDGVNLQLGRMFISVPLIEDDGTEFGDALLYFEKDSDLWGTADRFCNINEIEGEESRRELVGMMKKEGRRVWGVVVRDRGVTGEKMKEGFRGEGGEERKEDEHEEGVRVNTERAFFAVEDFMEEIGKIEKESGMVFKEKTMAMVEKSEGRRGEDNGVSKEAMEEAKQLLKAKVEKIKKEKMEEKRKKMEALMRAEEMRRVGAIATTMPPSLLPEEEKDGGEGKWGEQDEEREEEGKREETKLDDVVKVGVVNHGVAKRKTKQKVYEDDIGVGGDESDDSREGMFFDDIENDNTLLIGNRK